MSLIFFVCTPLCAQKSRLFTEYRLNPILADSVENVILNSFKTSVFILDSIAMDKQRQIQGYTYEKKFLLNSIQNKDMIQYMLHPKTFIKSEYKVMTPFIPEVAVTFKKKKECVTLLFALKSSTVQVFYNKTRQNDILIDNNHELMFIIKKLLTN